MNSTLLDRVAAAARKMREQVDAEYRRLVRHLASDGLEDAEPTDVLAVATAAGRDADQLAADVLAHKARVALAATVEAGRVAAGQVAAVEADLAAADQNIEVIKARHADELRVARAARARAADHRSELEAAVRDGKAAAERLVTTHPDVTLAARRAAILSGIEGARRRSSAAEVEAGEVQRRLDAFGEPTSREAGFVREHRDRLRREVDAAAADLARLSAELVELEPQMMAP